MRNRTSGSMRGERKRSVAAWPKLPRLSSTLPETAEVTPVMTAKKALRPCDAGCLLFVMYFAIVACPHAYGVQGRGYAAPPNGSGVVPWLRYGPALLWGRDDPRKGEMLASKLSALPVAISLAWSPQGHLV